MNVLRNAKRRLCIFTRSAGLFNMAGEGFRMEQLSRGEVLGLVFRLTLFGAISYYGVRWIVNAMDPTRKQKVEAQKQAERIMSQIGIKNVKLNEYELSIAAHLVDPASVTVTWKDIAGLEAVIKELQETVILPIQRRELFADSVLIKPPKGVLLHGPPGCGKTMIAKATAREANARFINLELSSLTDKWYGESQKLAAAVFSLAIKVQPTIIFIDEIDSFLRLRNANDHEATAMMKAQFMSLWDGLITDPSCQVVVMGATNRPQDVDRAILRRMPSMFHIGLPNLHQRKSILRLILTNEMVCEDVDYDRLTRLTEGYSGSDLRELCRNSAIYRIRDYIGAESSSQAKGSSDEDEMFHDALRPINMDDFINALTKIQVSKLETGQLQPQATNIDLD